MVDKGGASFFGSIGFDGGAAGRGAGGTSSWRLLNILIIAALPYITTELRNYTLLVYRGFYKKGKRFTRNFRRCRHKYGGLLYL
jgi:hypothetical protein